MTDQTLEERLDEILEEFDRERMYIEAKQALLSAFRDEQVALLERVNTEVIGDGRWDSTHNFNAHQERQVLRIEQRTALQTIKAEVEGRGE